MKTLFDSGSDQIQIEDVEALIQEAASFGLIESLRPVVRFKRNISSKEVEILRADFYDGSIIDCGNHFVFHHSKRSPSLALRRMDSMIPDHVFVSACVTVLFRSESLVFDHGILPFRVMGIFSKSRDFPLFGNWSAVSPVEAGTGKVLAVGYPVKNHGTEWNLTRGYDLGSKLKDHHA